MVVGYLAGNPITDRVVHAAHEAQPRESTAPPVGE
jgi:hypothetical protein